MKLKIILLHLSILLLGSSCTKPLIQDKVTIPERTRSGIKYTQDDSDLRRIAWWKKLHDAQLNELITQALACNNTIKSAYATIGQAQAQLKAAQYAWIPTLNATGSDFTGRTWDAHNTPKGRLANSLFFTQGINPKFNGYFSGFVPGYTLNILKNINNIRAAKATLVIEQAQTQSIKLGIISQMSGTYFMLLSQREQLAVQKTLSQDLKKLRQLEHVRFQKGANTVEQMIDLDQQLAQENAKIPQIERIVSQSENTIHLLLNQNPGTLNTHHSVLTLNGDSLIPKSLPSSVLKNRPDLIIAANNLKIAEAQIGIAYSAFFPTISLTGLLGGASLDLTHILNFSTNLWIAEAAASTKIFNASAYQNIKSAKAGLKSIYYDYLHTLHTAFAEVDNALTDEQKNRLSYLYSRKGYEAAQKIYTIALTQYKAGAKDYRNVLTAKITLDRSKLNLIQEKAQLLDSIVQVYSAVAGGYDVS